MYYRVENFIQIFVRTIVTGRVQAQTDSLHTYCRQHHYLYGMVRMLIMNSGRYPTVYILALLCKTSSTGQTGTVFIYFISHTVTISASVVRAQPPKRAAHFCVPINKHQCCQCFTIDVTDLDKIAHISQ